MRAPPAPLSRGRPTAAVALVAAAVISLYAACGDGGTGLPPADSPASLTIVSGNNQSGTVGSTLVQPLVVRVRNAADAPMAGVTIEWTVVAGAGTLGAATSASNAQGDAQIAYALGPDAGANQVRATVQGSTLSATFTATGTARPPDLTPAAINLVSGNNQSATVGTALPLPLVVDVRNAGGETLSGIAVAWTVVSGGGSLGQATTTTNVDGEATNTYTVGASAGTNTVKAAVQSNPAINVSFTATATALANTASVSVGNNFFSPSNATLATGGTVTWTWAAGAFTHNITWVSGGFTNSGDKSSGTHQVTFPASGTFQYYCSIHGTPTTGMRGTVTVP